MKSTTPFLAILCGAATATSAKKSEFDHAEYCPGSLAPTHAKCSMVVTFPSNACAQVASEISARIRSASWIDPHNAGTYSTSDEGGSDGGDTRVIEGERITGDRSYTDKFKMSFVEGSATASGTGPSCKVMACSESQVFSVLDFSTNYCNLRNLYCNHKDDGCVVESVDFVDYNEEYVSCRQNVKNKCIVPTSKQ